VSTIESPASAEIFLGIRPIAELGRGDVAFAGGKGANPESGKSSPRRTDGGGLWDCEASSSRRKEER